MKNSAHQKCTTTRVRPRVVTSRRATSPRRWDDRARGRTHPRGDPRPRGRAARALRPRPRQVRTRFETRARRQRLSSPIRISRRVIPPILPPRLPRLESYDPATCRGRIEHDGATLAVDASVVPSADAPRIGSLYQYIGELDRAGAGGGPDPTAPRPVLRARVARCVDGLDVRVYFSAHREREKFLNPRKKASAGGGRT